MWLRLKYDRENDNAITMCNPKKSNLKLHSGSKSFFTSCHHVNLFNQRLSLISSAAQMASTYVHSQQLIIKHNNT